MDRKSYGIPPEEIERARSEGKVLIPIGRNVPMDVTEERLEFYIPDPDRRILFYKSALEAVIQAGLIPNSYVEVKPEHNDVSSRVVDLAAYQDRKKDTD